MVRPLLPDGDASRGAAERCTSLLSRSGMWRLMPVAVVIGFLSLSVHVVMLQVLGIPYPDMSGIGRVGLVLVALRTIALVAVYRLARFRLGDKSRMVQVLVVALLDTMVAGNLRASIMEAVITASPSYPAIGFCLRFAESVVLAALVVASRPMVGSCGTVGTYVATAVLGLALTGLDVFVLSPMSRMAAQWFAALRRPEIYGEPYGVYVLSWSYAAYLETVAGVFATVFLVDGALSARRWLSLLQFVTLVLLLRGTLVMQMLFPWSMRGDLLQSALSTSQFFLQDLVLVVLVWRAWRSWSMDDRSRRGRIGVQPG